MVQTVNMTAPVANGQYVAKSGTVYTADANRVIAVQIGDIESLTNLGCIVEAVRPIVTPVVSSYIQQGAINKIAASTLADAFTLAAPAVIGMKTTIVNQSTGVPTITSSGCEILSASAGVMSVLTGTTRGTVELEALNSSQYQIVQRSLATSSGGPVYNITSS